MTYAWTTNHDTPVAVDGNLGPLTLKALQYGLGVTDDGVFGPVSTKALQTFLNVTVDGVLGQQTVKALQTLLKVSVDGDWGAQTTTQLQAALNAGAMGGAVAMPKPAQPSAQNAIPEADVTYAHYTGGGNATLWMTEAMSIAGVSGNDWQSGLTIICNDESSNNPNVANGWDLNNNGPVQADGYDQNCSRGIAQCIPPTFAEWHCAGTSTDIYDPVANIAAAIRYIIATYGSIDNVPGVRSVRQGGDYQGY